MTTDVFVTFCNVSLRGGEGEAEEETKHSIGSCNVSYKAASAKVTNLCSYYGVSPLWLCSIHRDMSIHRDLPRGNGCLLGRAHRDGLEWCMSH